MRRALRLSLTVYAALLVAPAATVVSGPTWQLFALGAVAGALLSVPFTDRYAEPEHLRPLLRMLGGFVLPLSWLWPAWVGATSIPTFLFTPWFAGALASLVWFVAVVVAAEWDKRDRLDAMAELAAFEARQPPEQRRQIRIVGVAAGVMVVVYLAISFAIGWGIDSTSAFWALPAMMPIWIQLLGENTKEVTIADEGFVVDRQIHDWNTIDGYELTDDALTITRPRWYHADLSFDRSDIDDLDAVTAALDEQVD